MQLKINFTGTHVSFIYLRNNTGSQAPILHYSVVG